MSDDQLNAETVKTLVDLGRSVGQPYMVEGGNVPFAVVPNQYHVEGLAAYRYNEYADRPVRINANVSVLDPESFVEYYRQFADAKSRVFADETKVQVVGVLDYHEGPDEPRWAKHRVTLNLRESEQWKTWFGSNNKQYGQQAFAEFLEQNAVDIIKPNSAAIVEVARDLNATTEVEFASGFKNENGQTKLKYTEQVKANVGSGQVSVPDRFSIELPVFIGGTEVQMEALLRFRVKEGHLVLWYTLLRPDEVKRHAFMAARDKIVTDAVVPIINGSVG